MNRYKLKREDFPAAIKYIKGKSNKGDSPNWAVKFKDDLTVHGKNIKFKGLDIIPIGEVDKYLRTVLMDPAGDVPFARDSAFHILKKRVKGIGRRQVMEFFRAQRTLGETRAALPKPKVQGGEKLKKYTVEVDLIFVRKNDLVNSNPRFNKKDELKFETYIVSSVEKLTGLTKLSYVTTKKAAIVTPIVKEHIKQIAKSLGVKPSQCALRFDKGGEFSVKELKKLVPDVKNVAMGSSIEARNRMIQQAFFRIIKNRRALTIKNALKQSEVIVNQSYNKIQKATPNEMVEKKVTKKETVAQYNRTRKTHVPGDSRKPFEVGEFVRILIKKPKSGLDYKSYKNMAYSAQVFQIQKRTQGTRRDQPIKYRVNKKWFTQDKLLKSAKRDQISEQIIQDRDAAEDEKEEKAEAKQEVDEEKRFSAWEIRKEQEIAAGTRRRTRSGASARLKEKLRKQREEGKRLDKLLGGAIKKTRKRLVKRKRIKKNPTNGS